MHFITLQHSAVHTGTGPNGEKNKKIIAPARNQTILSHTYYNMIESVCSAETTEKKTTTTWHRNPK